MDSKKKTSIIAVAVVAVIAVVAVLALSGVFSGGDSNASTAPLTSGEVGTDVSGSDSSTSSPVGASDAVTTSGNVLTQSSQPSPTQADGSVLTTNSTSGSAGVAGPMGFYGNRVEFRDGGVAFYHPPGGGPEDAVEIEYEMEGTKIHYYISIEGMSIDEVGEYDAVNNTITYGENFYTYSGAALYAED